MCRTPQYAWGYKDQKDVNAAPKIPQSKDRYGLEHIRGRAHVSHSVIRVGKCARKDSQGLAGQREGTACLGGCRPCMPQRRSLPVPATEPQNTPLRRAQSYPGYLRRETPKSCHLMGLRCIHHLSPACRAAAKIAGLLCSSLYLAVHSICMLDALLSRRSSGPGDKHNRRELE